MLDGTVRGTTNLLVYEDIEPAQNYLVTVFGLIGGQLERDRQGTVFHGEVRAGDQVIWLHPAGEGIDRRATRRGLEHDRDQRG